MEDEKKSEQEVGYKKPPVDHQFQPGQSGNPAGKPKGSRSISTILRDYMDVEMEVIDPITKKTEKKKISEIISLKLLSKAIGGDQKAIETVMDRLEGKAAQRIDFGGGESGKPGITLEIIHTNAKPQGDSGPGQEPPGIDKVDSQ